MTNTNDRLAEFSSHFLNCKRYKAKLQDVLALKPVEIANCAMFDILDLYDDPKFKDDIKLFAERYHISERAVIETYFMGYMLKYILGLAKINFNESLFKQ